MKYIFQIKIKPGHTVEEYAEAWTRGSEVIQKSTGAKGTRLYRKIGEDDALLAIAEWESKEARDTVMEELRKADPTTQEILNKHLEYGEISHVGAFDETEWKVFKNTLYGKIR